MKKTANFIKTMEGFTGDARLYNVDPAIGFDNDYDTDKMKQETKYVIVSATRVLGEDETYVFPADETGKVSDWTELDGSFRGEQDHKRALENAGYKII